MGSTAAVFSSMRPNFTDEGVCESPQTRSAAPTHCGGAAHALCVYGSRDCMSSLVPRPRKGSGDILNPCARDTD